MQAGMTAKQAAFSFLISDVFTNLFPSDTSFVQALYGDVLGSAVDSFSLTAFVGALEAGWTPVEVATSLGTTDEFSTRANATAEIV
jgi:hypothetical protein